MGVVETYLNVQKSSEMASSVGAEQHFQFVKRIAEHLSVNSQLPQSISLDDLVQEGMLALLEIYDQFDKKLGVNFETFASLRVRGAMVDLLRKTMPLSKEKINLVRKSQQFIEDYRNYHESKPKEALIAEYLGISLEKYRVLLVDYERGVTDDIDEYYPIDMAILTPEHYLDQLTTKKALISSIKKLSEREKSIMSLYYVEELTFAEIGQVLSLSESRVSQIHKLATNKLRKMLRALSREVNDL